MNKTKNRRLSKIRHNTSRNGGRRLKKNKETKHKKLSKMKHNRTLRRVKNKGGFFYNNCKDVKIEDLAAGYKSIESLDAIHSLYQRCCPSTNLGFTKIKNKTALCRAIDNRANMLIKEDNDRLDNGINPMPSVYHYDKTQPGPSMRGKLKSFIQPSTTKGYDSISNK